MKTFLLWLFSKVVVVLLVLVAFGLGYLLRGWLMPAAPQKPGTGDQTQSETDAVVQWWTCSMHPQIHQPKPGKCPICGMDLILVPQEEGQELGSPRRLVISEAGKKLAEIQTTSVERKFVAAEIRMVGKVDYDETRIKYISAWVPGRLDRLYVDYTGVEVKKGDHMAWIYSPELYAAQEELIQAIAMAKDYGESGSPLMADMTRSTVEAVREKLRLLGLTKEQMGEIEESGKPSEHVTIYASIGGTVIEKNKLEGDYVKTGTRIYTIADFSTVWVKLDAYESDLMWLRYGQKLTFTTEAYPGETFAGTISFIAPMLNPKTRTTKVRVNVPNPQRKLKPGMFVRAVVRADVALGGRVMEPDLAGRWICPMHPEIIKPEFGSCDMCGMDLVTAESLGYVSSDRISEPPLVIPASAPLITGRRAVVYVEVPGTSKPTYEGREVVLGPRAGDYYLVKSGLTEGDRVVTRGNFKIDSALQIQAKPSMMMPEERPPQEKPPAEPLEVPAEFREQLIAVLDAYVKLQESLAENSEARAGTAAHRLAEALGGLETKLLRGHARDAWGNMSADLNKAAEEILDAGDDIEKQRKGFAILSEALIGAVKRFGAPAQGTVFHFTCPMAFDGRGAVWLQKDKEIRNPYFGAAMLRCGEIVETISGDNSHRQGGREHE